ncbi:MAG: DUF3800 domain-containing protein [Thermoleophilia bacterium]
MSNNPLIHHYFVDESGDLTLFNKRGSVIVGNDGVSKMFMVGVAHIPDPDRVHHELETLRSGLLDDPYFNGVPSMQPAANKTAICFHAKDDLPEVRREVFSVLSELGIKVQVAIRRKAKLAAAAKISYKMGSKIQQNSIYDDLVKRLFRNMLHKADGNTITFAHRGSASRQEALGEAIARAKINFESHWNGTKKVSPTDILSTAPSNSAGLQVIDYYLWAIQRMYERGEDRFFNLLAPDYRLIMDLDDIRNKPYGEWYSDSNRLSLENIKLEAS